MVAGVGDMVTPAVRGGLMEHTVGAKEALLPGLGAEDPGLADERYRLSQQLVEAMPGDILGLGAEPFLRGGRTATQGGEEITDAPLGGKDLTRKAKETGIVGVTGFMQGA
jgi:hypothetical protein